MADDRSSTVTVMHKVQNALHFGSTDERHDLVNKRLGGMEKCIIAGLYNDCMSCAAQHKIIAFELKCRPLEMS